MEKFCGHLERHSRLARREARLGSGLVTDIHKSPLSSPSLA
jgi:hypothetical protein